MALQIPPPDLTLEQLRDAATVLYVTSVHTLRGDEDSYMFAIDRCYRNVKHANDRVELLGRCNTNPNPLSREIKETGKDKKTGGKWLRWTRDGSEKSRFYVEVKKMIMLGVVNTTAVDTGEDEVVVRGRFTDAVESKKEQAGHVWLVAIHRPDQEVKIATHGKPEKLAWRLAGIDAASDDALYRAKQIWKKELNREHGKLNKVSQHYGLARWVYVDHEQLINIRARKYYEPAMSPHVRIERVRVVRENVTDDSGGMLPAEAVVHKKPFKELYPGRDEQRLEELRQHMELAMDKAIRFHDDEQFRFPASNYFCDQRAPPSTAYLEEYNVVASMLRGSPPDARMASYMRKWSSNLYHTMIKTAAENERLKTDAGGA